jgi:hypothetical protein
MRDGRPLSRGGTASSRLVTPPMGSRPASSARMGSAVRPGSALSRTAAGVAGGSRQRVGTPSLDSSAAAGGARGQEGELRGVMALLASAGGPATRAPANRAPDAVSGGSRHEEVGAADAITFPLAAGVRGMLRKGSRRGLEPSSQGAALGGRAPAAAVKPPNSGPDGDSAGGAAAAENLALVRSLLASRNPQALSALDDLLNAQDEQEGE